MLWRSQCEFYSVVPDAVAWNPSPSCRINYTRMQVRITDWKCGRPTSCGAEFFISMRIYRFNFYISGLLVRLAYYQRVAPVFFLEEPVQNARREKDGLNKPISPTLLTGWAHDSPRLNKPIRPTLLMGRRTFKNVSFQRYIAPKFEMRQVGSSAFVLFFSFFFAKTDLCVPSCIRYEFDEHKTIVDFWIRRGVRSSQAMIVAATWSRLLTAQIKLTSV